MKLNHIVFGAAGLLAAAIPVSAQQATNNLATQTYEKTQVQPQIRLNLDQATESVHFIRDNTDPYVVTKTYVLKYADPYELRPYLRVVAQSKKISENDTFVECIKYNDGTGILIVSAEEDRFGKQEHGMGIDEIVATLDQPKITSSSGSVRLLYFPKYRGADELADMVFNVGMNHTNDALELEQGKDKVCPDAGLNALMFYVPKYSKKNIESMLQLYDTPILQAAVKYTVYEVDAENDGKIGSDFQDWKNNDGADLFSTGGRYRSNWTSTWSGGIDPTTGSNKTQYFNFNPKWNSKYLDFLVSKSKAKVMTSGEVVVRNNTTALIDKTTNVFYDSVTPSQDQALDQTVNVSSKVVTSKKPATYSNPYATPSAADYYFSAKDIYGKDVVVNESYNTNVQMYKGDLGAIKVTTAGAHYILSVDGATLVKNGENIGTQAELGSFTLYKKTLSYEDAATSYETWTAVAWTNDVTIAKGPTINTVTGPGFGFKMYVTPQVCRDTSSITVQLTNSSLIGWKSNGEPRIAKNDSISTDIMISNRGNRFVIGGLEKETVVRSVGGVPYLREIPGMGWLFATESESTKKSQLIVVAECNLIADDAPLAQAVTGTTQEIKNGLKNAGESNQWGFGQYWLDK